MAVTFDHTLTIAQLARLLRARRLSPVELTRAVLERIERQQPRLNAFITVTADLALRQAAAAEKEIMRGRWRGALHGIPVCVKDLFHVKGVRTTAGSRILADFVAGETAAAVERLLHAGAVLVGKTNLHEFAYGPTNLNPHYGDVRNPWNPERMSGGSSGGSAAAVAAGLALAALGTDTGGSIRIPAAACGCVGLKPTYGRVPLRGVIPLAASLDHAGPLCRCVQDAAIVLGAIAGADPADPWSYGRPGENFSRELRRGLRGIRVGVPRQYFCERVQPDVMRRVREAVAVLSAEGASVREVDLKMMDETARLAAVITHAEAILYHWRWLQTRPQDYGPDVRLRLEGGGTSSAAEYLQAQERRRAYAREMDKVLERVDLLAVPTLPVAAPRIDEASVRIGRRSEDTRLTLLRFTRPANVAGLPAISLPCGFTAENLPVGLQLIGRRRRERTLLRAAYAFEQATPWHAMFPPD
jgi:aspartyl-tRNA(Asn)/glutamyl-tRNA(Gln) amidotransferase subunit A